jgi:hypothetical protein
VRTMGTILGYKVSRYSRVVLLVDYSFWDKCVKRERGHVAILEVEM